MPLRDLDANEPADVGALLARLAGEAQVTGHRRLAVLAGERDWARACAQAGLTEAGGAPVLWVTDRPPNDAWAVSARQAGRLLGRETAHVVFDARAGLNPDAWGAVMGTIRAGGLLLLLTPRLDEWPDYPDPECERIAVLPYGPEDVGGRFLLRLVRLIRADDSALRIEQDARLPALPPTPARVAPPPETVPPCRTPDQYAAVEAVLKVARGRARRPAVLVADRGRGKSAALGIAAARLLDERAHCILLTAPRRSSVAPAFEHAAANLPDAAARAGHVRAANGGELRFVPPDELARATPEAELVLVDEAAAIPTPLLEALLQRYTRIAFASTVHGYEGSGRGFEVRFERVLDRHTPNWRKLRLETPIRWAPDDPLERFGFKALLLDAEPAGDAAPESDAYSTHESPARAASDTQIRRLDRDELARDEALLRDLFGLLVQAHYRTRPGDLRNLLDGPNLAVWATLDRGRVVAAALTAAEGGLDDDLTQAIWQGRRRPRGHVLTQSLVYHAGCYDAGAQHALRVVRIAVRPELQGNGHGSALLQAIVESAAAEGYDLIGSVFGATAGLIRFWDRGGLRPARLGITREASSGRYAAFVIRGLTETGRSLAEPATTRFAGELPLRLPEFYAGADADLVLALLVGSDAGPALSLSATDHDVLEAYCAGQHTYESAAIAIWKHTCMALTDPTVVARLDEQDGRILVAKILQKRDWSTAADIGGADGRSGGRERLLEAVRKLIHVKR